MFIQLFNKITLNSAGVPQYISTVLPKHIPIADCSATADSDNVCYNYEYACGLCDDSLYLDLLGIFEGKFKFRKRVVSSAADFAGEKAVFRNVLKDKTPKNILWFKTFDTKIYNYMSLAKMRNG
jgi:hypothetical protein